MIRYAKLGYVELNVSDLDRSRQFYSDVVGLEPVGEREDGGLLFRCDADPYSVVLHQGEAPGFKRAGWRLEDEAQFDQLHQRLRGAGAAFEQLSEAECRMRLFGRATRVVEAHTQATLEFYVPAQGQPAVAFSPTHTKIQRLGHVVFAAPEKDAAVAFFRDVLNFKESDSIGENVTFMRPFPNPYHHGIGVGRAPVPIFNHLNLMVTEIDDIGRAFNRMKRHNVPIAFGPGRHVASGSIFLYFLDPDGMTLEYSFGMEEFDEFAPRDAGVLPPGPQSIDTWGAVPDPRFGAVGAMEQARIAQAAG